MKTLTYGKVPPDLTIDEPYKIEANAADEKIIVQIVNQGIDAHLEAVHTTDHGIHAGKHHITIDDSASMRCFLRRCVEHGIPQDDETEGPSDLAACIMSTLDYEWV